MALRRGASLRFPTPDERGPHPHFGSRQFIPPPQNPGYNKVLRDTSSIPRHYDHVPEFAKEWDRARMRAFMEHRHIFWFYTRKTPEFWKNYQFYYKLGEQCAEWREAKVRARIQELFWNDATLCGMSEAFEVKRVADRLVKLIKDGGRESRRILQEFFEYSPWDGGRKPKSWSGAGEPGDMRVMYKVLDDYPQRFKNRLHNFTLVTPTHTFWARQGGPLIDNDRNKLMSPRYGRIVIVEMEDRDRSIFHRGQHITGDKGEDVWDAHNDCPILDVHRGFQEEPPAVRAEREIVQEMQQQREATGRDADLVVENPEDYVGYQKLEDADKPIDLRHERGSHKGQMQFVAQPHQASTDSYAVDLEKIEEFLKDMRYNATVRKLYKDENFYRMFPTIGDPAWIDKIYRPYMKMRPDRQRVVYQYLENINIHNIDHPPLTEGLPVPKQLEDEALEDVYRETWKKKMEIYKEFPHNDPRDHLGPVEREMMRGGEE